MKLYIVKHTPKKGDEQFFLAYSKSSKKVIKEVKDCYGGHKSSKAKWVAAEHTFDIEQPVFLGSNNEGINDFYIGE